jgi:hypothetical protein
MRKILLIFLLILFAAPLPCFSQTVHPQLHPAGNTLWKLFPQNTYFGFAGGVVYMCDESLTACEPAEDSFYSDFLLFALFYVPIREDYTGFMFGFIPVAGWRGSMIIYNIPLRYTLRGTLLLASDSWDPPE